MTVLDTRVPFVGAWVSVTRDHVDDSAFETLGAGKTVESVFDLARMFDLSPWGEYTVQAHDSIPAANSHRNTTGSIPYASNTLRLHVDGGQARHNPRVHGPARGCSWPRWPLSAAGCWPTGPKPAPTTGPPIDRMDGFFKRSDRPTRDAVTRTFRDVGAECTLNTMAATYPDKNRIVICDPFWYFIPTEQGACHSVDRGAVLVHEATRLRRCGAPLATTTITTPSLGTRSRPISTALTLGSQHVTLSPTFRRTLSIKSTEWEGLGAKPASHSTNQTARASI
ncbi:tRNA-guanine transglycosylase family protein [Metarhizium brunneum]